MNRAPLIIIGAGRSGTNALRDTLCSLPLFGTWPCDEINYIWRYGNRDHPTDELEEQHASAKSRSYVAGAFDRQQAKVSPAVLVEKTCANSLRLGYVDALMPDARFLVIERDPVDTVASAMERWTASLDIPYLVRKARFVPRSDLPVYAFRYARSRLGRSRADDDRLPTWGPRFEGLDDLVRANEPLHVVCAHQWAKCTKATREQAASIATERIAWLRYEELVNDPVPQLSRALQHLGENVVLSQLEHATAGLHAGSVGKGRSRLSAPQIVDVEAICGHLS